MSERTYQYREGRNYIGEIRLDGEVDITDPCYEKGIWCRMTEKCEPGIYTGYADIVDEGEWGMRVARIEILKDDIHCEEEYYDPIGSIGVDAGLAGFFRDKPDYPNDEWIDFLVESGVFKTRDEHDYSKAYYAIDYGLFSESGYGDGGYTVYANEERTAFMIEFIGEEDEDEDEDY